MRNALLYISFMVLGLCIHFSCSHTKSLTISDLESLASIGTPWEKETKNSCRNPINYAPYEEQLPFITERILRVNMHFMDSEDRSQNLPESKSGEFVYYLLDNANKRLLLNEKMNLPKGNETPNLSPRYQYKLWVDPDQAEKNGVYHHYDDSLYYFVNKGRNRNNYDRTVIKKYGIGLDSVLNIFFTPHHPDSIASKSYQQSGSGVALGTGIKLGNIWKDAGPAWGYATLLNHEVGHALGLSHSWYKTDGCEDTPPHKNKYTNGSNNMMDYNNSQMAISPCQLGIIHRNISTQGSTQRNLVVPSWCNYNAEHPIIIDKDLSLEGARDIDTDIIITESGALTIKCRVSMPQGSQIKIYPGGRLYLDNAHLHNACGETWKGITLIENKLTKAAVYYLGDTKIEDVEK